jgi:hypothetical protein
VEDTVRMTARLVLRACALVALTSAMVTAPSALAQSGGKLKPASQRQNYFQTESGPVVYVPMKATILDPNTNKARKLTADEVDELMVTLKPLQQPTASVAGAKRPGGPMGVTLDGRLEYVVLARAAADGTYETRCIGSVAEAVEFLGLKPVPADSPEANEFLGDDRN